MKAGFASPKANQHLLTCRLVRANYRPGAHQPIYCPTLHGHDFMSVKALLPVHAEGSLPEPEPRTGRHCGLTLLTDHDDSHSLSIKFGNGTHGILVAQSYCWPTRCTFILYCEKMPLASS